ncbi:phage integrase N-terminal SAM-like domain-containing protein [Litchfieldella qijiaojingensis]|uniref:phage integrase N-terminal SAM-like domain-containing protein n=1 Tax=Litchfieldella qijiaojingensis TaxID=980347 RepID=UPI0030EB3778
MDRIKTTLRVKRYSLRTEKTYCYWIRFFIRLPGVRHTATELDKAVDIPAHVPRREQA